MQRSTSRVRYVSDRILEKYKILDSKIILGVLVITRVEKRSTGEKLEVVWVGEHRFSENNFFVGQVYEQSS